VDNYYLEDVTNEEGIGAGGVLAGAIEQLGWKGEYILAWRRAIRGRSGWMVVNVATRSVTGPLSDEELAEARKGVEALRDIEVYPVKDAWGRLAH
jgi:hypothetical protein